MKVITPQSFVHEFPGVSPISPIFCTLGWLFCRGRSGDTPFAPVSCKSLKTLPHFPLKYALSRGVRRNGRTIILNYASRVCVCARTHNFKTWTNCEVQILGCYWAAGNRHHLSTAQSALNQFWFFWAARHRTSDTRACIFDVIPGLPGSVGWGYAPPYSPGPLVVLSCKGQTSFWVVWRFRARRNSMERSK